MSDLLPPSVDRRLAPSLLIPALLTGLLLASLPARATPIAYGAGLVAPAASIGFDGLAENTAVGSAYAARGVGFTGLFVTRQFGNTLGSTTAPAAANFLGGTVNAVFGISFASVLLDVAFFLATDGYGTTISATLNGAVVETVTAESYRSDGRDFFGFSGSALDGITVSVAGDGLAVIDDLQFNVLAAAAVPEPGSLAVLATGVLGAAGVRRRAVLRCSRVG